ncbi:MULTISPECIES: FAD-dependent monooxygenase [Kocuria]|uniref:FAD-dependent monooxygenase n=1 Tax=Kocuria TaxID=57493 RepID=UPI001F608E14|nr:MULTISPECIES: FAD-dependent monooxygenase [Kocuria]MDT0120071.1 FAD-dependent monooxygenase [Kocuria sp. PD6]
MVRPWNKWLITWGYDIEQPPPELAKESTREIVRNLIGDPNLDIEVESFSLWTVNEMRATRNMEGRVFAMGDATHRHPPSNGLGSNTSIGDAYNLAWKLAYVFKGFAGPELLGSYQDERVPVGEQIVKRANTSLGQLGAVLDALGVDPRDDAESMNRQIATRKEASEEGERRRQALRDALELKNYEFNAHGVELGQSYESSAVVADGGMVLVRPDNHVAYRSHGMVEDPAAMLTETLRAGRLRPGGHLHAAHHARFAVPHRLR